MSDPWITDYQAVIKTGGLIALAGWSQVQLSGGDRVKFLHNMCTNDIRRLEPGQSCEAFCTDVKGKIQAHVIVVANSEQLTLLTVPNQAERIIQHLDRYIIREDVQLSNVTDEFDWYLAIGPQDAHEDSSQSDFAPSNILGLKSQLVRKARTASNETSSPIAFDTNSPVWTALRTEAGFPLFGSDFDDTNLPQEINRDAQAINFNKGCYLGQETVARIDALGHVNKKLVLLKFAGVAAPLWGTTISAGTQEVGSVSTASWSPRLDAPLAMGFVRRGSNEIGTKLQSDFGDAEVIATPRVT